MKTERLLLRKRTPERLKDLINQPLEFQMKFLGYDQKEKCQIEIEGIKERLTRIESWNWVKWDIILKSSDQVIGSCGFHNWEKDHERAELGYILKEDFRRQGYMTEAIKSVVDYGFTTMNLNRIEAFISPDNTPSLSIVERLMFTKEGVLRQHYKFQGKIYDSVVYGLLKSEYK